ncbi:MAG: hypothetical protein KTR35_19280 [Gammaproteobacteria bacterium]|nr:hypothetical protein [Gammaproteobacteria bacterium]
MDYSRASFALSFSCCWLALLCSTTSQAQTAPITANDADGDQIVDTIDVDDDNDGIPDNLEIDANGSDLDTDGDGIVNRLDLDSDNDGLLDWQESGAVISIDFSSVRIVGGRLLGDVGLNGLINRLESPADTGNLRYALVHSDADGIPDVIDLDADNDGQPDLLEAAVSPDLDADGDARIDAPPGTVGVDGILDVLQTTNDVTCCDVNGDGVDDPLPVNTDLADLPDFQDLDSDNDSTSDLVELGGRDADGDGRVDNFFDSSPVPDGMDDVLLRIPLTSTDINGNGVPDQLDPFAVGHVQPGETPDDLPMNPEDGEDSEADTTGEPELAPDSDSSGSQSPTNETDDSSAGNEPLEDSSVGLVQTGANASGCSIGGTSIDLLLPLLALLSIAVLGWRMTLRRVR